MPFFSSQGRPIYYERHGKGPALLFLHGAGSNGATWWQQLPAFTPHYTCLLMDIRCFGRSAAPTSEFRLPLFVQDVIALLDHEEISRAALVGQSLGGMIGLRTALDHPQRVSAFVACDSSLAIDHPRQLEILDRRLESASALSIEQRSLGRWFFENQPALAMLYAQINHFNPSAHSIPPQAWRAAMQGLHRPEDLTPMSALPRLACPLLLLVGREDPIVPVDIMEEVAARVPGSELAVIDDAAHSAYFEQAATVNGTVLEFLERRLGAHTDHPQAEPIQASALAVPHAVDIRIT